MKITAIKQQLKDAHRYSVFVDNIFAFSLSDSALLAAQLVPGQELSIQAANRLKRLSADDKLYTQAIRYAALRARTEGQMADYLKRKALSEATIGHYLKRLKAIGLIDDVQFARSFVHDRRLLRPSSRRKLIAELRKRQVAEDIIQAAVGNDTDSEQLALQAIIASKRHQGRYQDKLKLMQYLVRQGFSYEAIKTALARAQDEEV